MASNWQKPIRRNLSVVWKRLQV